MYGSGIGGSDLPSYLLWPPKGPGGHFWFVDSWTGRFFDQSRTDLLAPIGLKDFFYAICLDSQAVYPGGIWWPGMHQNRSHQHHGTAEGRSTAKKWFGDRIGQSPCTHSMGKFFLCCIFLKLPPPTRPGATSKLLMFVLHDVNAQTHSEEEYALRQALRPLIENGDGHFVPAVTAMVQSLLEGRTDSWKGELIHYQWSFWCLRNLVCGCADSWPACDGPHSQNHNCN